MFLEKTLNSLERFPDMVLAIALNSSERFRTISQKTLFFSYSSRAVQSDLERFLKWKMAGMVLNSSERLRAIP